MLERAYDLAQYRCPSGGRGNDDFVRAVGRDDLLEGCSGAKHAHTMDAPSNFRRVVINEADRLVVVERVVLHVADDQLARVAGTNDQNATSARRPPQVAHNASHEADRREAEHQNERVDQEYRARISAYAEPETHQTDKDQRTGTCCRENVQQIPETGVPPQSLKEPEGHEDDEANEDEPRQHADEGRPILVRNVAVEPEPEREVVRRDDQKQV